MSWRSNKDDFDEDQGRRWQGERWGQTANGKKKKKTTTTFDPSGFNTLTSPGATGKGTWVNMKGDTRS